MIVIDGTDVIFGRMATMAAKKALQGEEIHVINSEKIILSGNPKEITDNFLARKAAKHLADPELSPKWPKVPHMLIKRMIRGMLPWKTPRGRVAYKKIFIYTGNPKELKAGEFEMKKYDGVSPHITVLRLCKMIGYRG